MADEEVDWGMDDSVDVWRQGGGSALAHGDEDVLSLDGMEDEVEKDVVENQAPASAAASRSAPSTEPRQESRQISPTKRTAFGPKSDTNRTDTAPSRRSPESGRKANDRIKETQDKKIITPDQPDTSKLPKQGAVPTPTPTNANAASLGSQSPLPPGWTQIESRSTGKIFFHNKATGETSWTKPSADDTNTAPATATTAQTPSASSSQTVSGSSPSAGKKDTANGREGTTSQSADAQDVRARSQAETTKATPAENRRTAFPSNSDGQQRSAGPSGNDRPAPSGPAGWRNGSDRGRDDGPNRPGSGRDERDRRDARDSRDSRDVRDRRDRRRTRSPSARLPDDVKRFKPDNGYPDRRPGNVTNDSAARQPPSGPRSAQPEPSSRSPPRGSGPQTSVPPRGVAGPNAAPLANSRWGKSASNTPPVSGGPTSRDDARPAQSSQSARQDRQVSPAKGANNVPLAQRLDSSKSAAPTTSAAPTSAPTAAAPSADSAAARRAALQEEAKRVEAELKRLDEEEARLAREQADKKRKEDEAEAARKKKAEEDARLRSRADELERERKAKEEERRNREAAPSAPAASMYPPRGGDKDRSQNGSASLPSMYPPRPSRDDPRDRPSDRSSRGPPGRFSPAPLGREDRYRPGGSPPPPSSSINDSRGDLYRPGGVSPPPPRPPPLASRLDGRRRPRSPPPPVRARSPPPPSVLRGGDSYHPPGPSSRDERDRDLRDLRDLRELQSLREMRDREMRDRGGSRPLSERLGRAPGPAYPEPPRGGRRSPPPWSRRDDRDRR